MSSSYGTGGCCGAVVGPCATYAAPVYLPTYTYWSGCGTCGNSWAYDRLAEPTTQYYYVNQGPTYSGPGAYAPIPVYRQDAVPSYGYRRSYGYRHHWGYYGGRPLVRRYY